MKTDVGDDRQHTGGHPGLLGVGISESEISCCCVTRAIRGSSAQLIRRAAAEAAQQLQQATVPAMNIACTLAAVIEIR